MADQLPEDYYNNGPSRRGHRARKLGSVLEDIISHPTLAEVMDPWSKKSVEDTISACKSYRENFRSYTREIELRHKETSASCRLYVGVSDKKSKPEADGTVMGTESVEINVSFGGFYGSMNLLFASRVLGWLVNISDVCSSIVSSKEEYQEKYVWCNAEQAARALEMEKKAEELKLVVAALKRDSKGARKGSPRRFKGFDLPPGNYTGVTVEYYGGRVVRTFDVNINSNGTGFFTRKL